MKNSRRVAKSGKAAGVAVSLMVLSVAHAGPALAAPKVNGETKSGDIKIHDVTTGADDNRNEPKVCAFTLNGDNFDANEAITYEFILGAPFKGTPALTGGLNVDALGSFTTPTINLAPGQWKVNVDDGEDLKFKVFKVECETPAPDPDPDPVVPDPVVPDPVVPDPVVPDPVVPDPVVPDPVVPDPVVPDPVVPDPVVPDPVVPDPVVPDPVVPDPVVPDPVTPDGDPAPDPDVQTEVLPVEPTAPVVGSVGNGAGKPTQNDSVVKGTWESASATLPQTGGVAGGIGAAGLLLVGAGLGLRRAVRREG